MKIKILEINDVIEVIHYIFQDNRGNFLESYNKNKYFELGIKDDFVQDNRAYSEKSGTIRGLHFQTLPAAQEKLIQVIQGRILDIFVDLRKGSPTYKQWGSKEFSVDKGNQLYLPVGFDHGYKTLEENCEIEYKVSDYYAPDYEAGIRWDDPELNIDWNMGDNFPVLSDKDMELPLLCEIDPAFEYDVG
ncbi:MAG: dTDP-4-dehydrorhamnose 3,5-epimerase [Proteobacteria bacterium]|nr:dTDP-4-dehydrorhamnose 3,5-epimerase [Pseudomonadota bacterium]